MMLQFTEAGRRPLRQVNHLLFSAFLGSLLLTMVPLANAAPERTIAPASVFIDMEGQFAGRVHSVSGGYTKAQLGETYDDRSSSTLKRVTGLEVVDLEVYFGVDMAPSWWQWVSESMGAKPGLPRNMAVVGTDFDGQQMERLVLPQARIKQIEFPVFDRSNPQPVIFKVVITAGSSQYETLGGGSSPAVGRPNSRTRTDAFRFELGDLPTTKTARVTPPVFSIDFSNDSVGAYREPTPTVGSVNVGNMILAHPRIPGDQQQYMQWLQDLIQGRNSEESKLTSSLTLLDVDTRQDVMTIHFGEVGLVGIDPYQNSGIGPMTVMHIETYVDRMWVEMAR